MQNSVFSNISRAYYSSPIGTIEIAANEKGISLAWFTDTQNPSDDSPLLEKAVTQIDEYFHGTRKDFDLPLAAEGTAFQKKVWDELVKIPFGKTVSYQDIAKRIGDLNSIRAVGMANGRNPISIIVPCHRVIGSDGSLTGYGGGLWRKKMLLEHENPPGQLALIS